MRDIFERAYVPRALAGNLSVWTKQGWTVESEDPPGKPVTHWVIHHGTTFGQPTRERKATTATDQGGFHLIRRRRAA